ncbi:Glycosyltransferase involved in cell wall bisynthesis [Lachnospiraceae bacterium XBB2008]|nr:Glycosyltransferase involved in cell wall bisynthesis [Lachnospiraceae bacterium XBB2008]
MNKISVIIPCYNAEPYIDRCLQSIMEQTYPMGNIEVICVNDASTDDTLERLKEWEHRYPDNICVVDCTENGHLGTARNIGLDYASGEWVAFVDADDWIEREYIEVLYEAANRHHAQMSACREKRDPSSALIYFENDTVTDRADNVVEFRINDENKRKRFFKEQPLKLYAWGKLISKAFLVDNELYFPENLAYEDIVWGNLVNMYIESAVLIDRYMYHYYVNPESIVLKRNGSYHMDHLTTQEIMWAQFNARGFLENYRTEMEYEYLYNGYLGMLKILALRYDEPSYSAFRLLQELTGVKVGTDSCDRFASDPSVPEIHRLLFGMVHQYVSKSAFLELVDLLRRGSMI